MHTVAGQLLHRHRASLALRSNYKEADFSSGSESQRCFFYYYYFLPPLLLFNSPFLQWLSRQLGAAWWGDSAHTWKLKNLMRL